MVAQNENPNNIADDSKTEMVREALQIHTADIALANREGFGPLRGLRHIMPKLRIKIIGKLWRRSPLVIRHDLVDIRIYLRM